MPSLPPPPQPFDDGVEREKSFARPATVGLILFLAALFMLFFASLLGYWWIRTRMQSSPAAGSLHLPWLLWLSTALVVGVSAALAIASKQIQAGQHRSYRNALTAALALGGGFITVQTPALINLVAASRTQNIRIYMLIFFLVLLHALHVVGGMISLVRVTLAAHKGAFDKSHHDPLRHTAMYWHFLDGVWIVMFTLFWFTR